MHDPIHPGEAEPLGLRPGRARGLTLIELIVVLVILVALGGIIVPLFGDLGQQSREDATRETLLRVAQAIDGPGGYAETMRYAREPGGGAPPVLVGEGSGLPWPSDTDQSTDGRPNHPQLTYLFETPAGLDDYDPVTRIGWRGAVLSQANAAAYQVTGTGAADFTSAYGQDDDLAPLDGWGNPVVIQLPDVTVGSITDEEIEHVRLVSAGRNGQIETPANQLAPTATGDDVVVFLRRENP